MGFEDFIGQGVTKVKGVVSSAGIEQQSCVRSFARMCSDGWELGWHERNGGNASYRMTPADVQSCRTFFLADPSPWTTMNVCVPGLAGEYFLVTGAGKFMRNVALDPSASIGIVEIDATGSAYRVVWGLDGGARPTSEFSGHLMMHAVRKRASDGRDRVLYHCHPTDVVALTCAIPHDDRAMTRALWKMMTECVMVFPEGVGVVGPSTPGSIELAEATAQKMNGCRAVVWAHHGLAVAGESFDDAFGLAHVVVKAAAMYKSACIMCGGEGRERGLADSALKAIADDLGLSLPEGYLS